MYVGDQTKTNLHANNTRQTICKNVNKKIPVKPAVEILKLFP